MLFLAAEVVAELTKHIDRAVVFLSPLYDGPL